jgi:hypothetical protein
MSSPLYSTGDTVVLKGGLFRKAETALTCRIASVLPEAQGVVQYRVRFGDETFERRVTESDIDRTATTAPKGQERPASPSATSSWVNLNTIKIRK